MIGSKVGWIDRFARRAAVRLYILLWLLVAIALANWAWFGETGRAVFGSAS
jgi:hypothetical protein